MIHFFMVVILSNRKVVHNGMQADILDYIEVFYNRRCQHYHLSNVSPEAFEQVPL
jgi:hypothetical protein